MATQNAGAWEDVQTSIKQLHASIPDLRSDPSEINCQLAKYRVQCDNLIFADFSFAKSEGVEAKLWEIHGKVNNRFRKQLSHFRDGSGKRKVVEQRKLMKHYLEFIKSSQRYYRGYIRKLAAHFGGIPEVEAVAHRFVDKSAPAMGPSAMVPDDLRHVILLSCHQCLVRLGDLSRYRETELSTKERNWGPAIGYYDLAGAIMPSSGASHNQLAVIALADGNHLRATYHLYRALAVEELHPTAKGNLEIEFKKILAASEKGELIGTVISTKETSGPGKALLGWFMRLHAQCYKGVDFVGHDELENEVMTHLAIELKERSLEGTLRKFAVINIAAEYFAGVRLQSSPESKEIMQAFFFFQRLNVRTMFTLLQVLQPELESFAAEEPEESLSAHGKGSEKITAIARRVLPGLRHYSSWLMSNKEFLVAQIGDTSLNVQIKELWKTYANTLTLVAATFPVTELPLLDYLLEEDEDTLGFKPFENDRTRRRYYANETGNRKPKFHEDDVERQHPNIEMLSRIRDFLTDGLELALDEIVPVELVDGTTTFTFREEGMPSELLASPGGRHATISSTNVERDDISQAKNALGLDQISEVDDNAGQSLSASVSSNQVMNEMVDNIVGSETTNESDLGNDQPDLKPRGLATPPSYSFDDSPIQNGNETSYGLFGTATAHELMQGFQSLSPGHPPRFGTPRPVLPSIYNSPFAPMCDEVSSRPGTARLISPTRSPLVQNPSEFQAQLSFQAPQDPSSNFIQDSPGWSDGYGNTFNNAQRAVVGEQNTGMNTMPTWNYGSGFDVGPYKGSPSNSTFTGRTGMKWPIPPSGQTNG